MSNLLVNHSRPFSPPELRYHENDKRLPQRNSALSAKMKVSIVIPCYNEADTIEKIVEAVRNAPLQSRKIIVVDDCSQDGTQTLLRERISQIVDWVVYHLVNRAKRADLRVRDWPYLSKLTKEDEL